MPAMDLSMIESLGRDLHSHSPGYISEDEVCPWTLFLTMALTLLKGTNQYPIFCDSAQINLIFVFISKLKSV